MINEDCTKHAVLFNSKKRILEYISELAHQHLPHISRHDILDSLMSREKLGSTGIGKGIALPHGRLKNTEQTIAIVLVNQHPIEFDAIDKKPVDIFFALLVPEEQCKEHLSTLSSIAKTLNEKATLKMIRNAESDKELYEILLNS